jgi:hypothetical protein
MNQWMSRILIASLAVGASAVTFATDPPSDLLRGPEVTGAESRSSLGMLDSGARRRASVQTVVPVRQWFDELKLIALEPAQLSKIEAFGAAFQERSNRFRTQHADRLKALKRQIRRLEAELPSDQTPGEDLIELRLERSTLQARAPKVTDLQQQCWSLLTRAQQDAFRDRLEVVRTAIRREQAIQRLKEQAVPVEGSMQGEGGMQEMSDAPAGDAMMQDGEKAPARLPETLEGFD